MSLHPMPPGEPSRRSVLGWLGAAPLAAGALSFGSSVPPSSPSAGTQASLNARIQKIIHRPEIQGSQWGMEFTLLDSQRPRYSIVADQDFEAASAAKIFTAATVFSTLGPGYRFTTPVYRTGPVRNGVLEGDLVLVASGDLLLSNRVQPDGGLALPIPDHSYDMPDTVPIPGDPLCPLRSLARQVAAQGITQVSGQVLVDTSLFQQAQESIGISAAGLVTVSPIMINDNIIDVTVTPGAEVGAPAVLHISPPTDYLGILNQVTTVPASSASTATPLSFTGDITNPEGTQTVTLTGQIAVGTPHLYRAYYIPEPAVFAQMAFAEVLRDAGVGAQAGPPASAGIGALAPHYAPGNRVAAHVSPPVSEEIKVMLKTSSNVHVVMWIYVDGAIAGHDSTSPKDAYNQLQADEFARAGLNPDPPGSADGEYTSAFFVQFLDYLARQPYFGLYRDALPIMGKDGSLAGIEVHSPAAGHVYAKTGTGVTGSANSPVLDAALAGFIQLPDGRWMAFAEFMNVAISSPADATAAGNVADEAMGEIATAVYECS
jgi:serine-type D-Ala-D-Ala carboxypeptidase/endopeptidase (penicillin-binding protein 4)